ncbi:MAG: chemotaxis protein CheC [Candidatus Tectimicrobiota bacterium]
MLNLTELQRDTITELLNIGVGRAAAALSEMVGEEIELSVPSIEVLSRREAMTCITGNTAQRIVAVQQQFSGSFWGDTMLIFPEAQSLELVRSIMQETLPLEVMTEMEQEAFLEIGNIILNACIGSIANMLQSEVCSSLPVLLCGSCEEILDGGSTALASEEAVMLLRMGFALQQQAMQGCVVFIVDHHALVAIQSSVDHFLSHI